MEMSGEGASLISTEQFVGIRAKFSLLLKTLLDFALFNKLDQSRKKILITNDDVDYSTSTVEHLPLSRFLLMESLEG